MQLVILSTFAASVMLVRTTTAIHPPGRRADYSGKMTWIGDTTGMFSTCGPEYEDDSMFVAVTPSLLNCGSGSGSAITIQCNGVTVEATVVDSCVACGDDRIDVATAVYEACGFSTGDGGIQYGISWSF